MEYNPSQLVVRIQHFINDEPCLQTSLSLDNDDEQGDLFKKVQAIAQAALKGAELKPQPSYLSEIILGSTANKLERQEELLNDCRNLLIDLEELKMPEETRRIFQIIMTDLDDEVD